MSLVAGVCTAATRGFRGRDAAALAALRLAPIAARPVSHAILIPFTMLAIVARVRAPAVPSRAGRLVDKGEKNSAAGALRNAP
jgi:hypothetical protein